MTKKNKIGRPTIMTIDVVNKLEQAFSWGCTDLEACLFANISKQTLYNYQDLHPEFIDRKERLKESPVLLARQTVVMDLQNSSELSLKFLERKKKDEFGLRTESRQVDKEGNDLKNVVYIEKEETEAINGHIDSVIDGD